MKNKQNKASIVLDLLTKISSLEDTTTMQKAWSEVLDCELGNLQMVSSAPSTIISILKEIEVYLENINHIRDLNVYYIPLRTIVNAIFNTTFKDNVKSLRDKIDNQIPGLSSCADILNSNNINENVLSKDEIAEIRAQSEELIEQIISSEINSSAKAIFIEILNKFRDATIEYQLKGVSALKEAFSAGIGSLVIQSAVINNYAQDSQEKKFGNKLIKYMEKVNTIVGFATNTQIAIPFFEEMIKKLT
jgi:hypothetical protein